MDVLRRWLLAGSSLVLPVTAFAVEPLWIDRDHQGGIAEQVAIAGNGQVGVAGWWLNSARVALYRVPGGSGAPEWSHPLALADRAIAVDANAEGDRITSAARGESLLVFEAASPDPLFADWFAPPYLACACAVSDDGTTFAGAAEDPSGPAGEVRVYSGATGALRFVRALTAKPEGLCVSGDGRFVAANTRGYVKVWDAITGASRDSLAIPGETAIPAVLSDDGVYLVTGGFAKTVRLYRWNGADYVQSWAHTIPGTTRVTALAISRDGTTIVAGTWTNPDEGQVVVYNRTSPDPIWTDASFGDQLASVAVTPNGQRIAAASWGRLGGSAGSVISVYERATPIPRWTVLDDALAGVGSCMSIDVSESGGFVLAGGKAVHARETGSGGFVLALDIRNPAGVADLGAAPALTVWPNPFRGSLHIGGVPATDRRVSIWSADGRLVRSVDGAWWNGRDDAGRDVPVGVYFVRHDGATCAPVRVVRLR